MVFINRPQRCFLVSRPFCFLSETSELSAVFLEYLEAQGLIINKGADTPTVLTGCPAVGLSEVSPKARRFGERGCAPGALAWDGGHPSGRPVCYQLRAGSSGWVGRNGAWVPL